jgi:hypothetical protein
MLRLSRLPILVVAGLAAGLILGACSSSSSGPSCGGGSPPNLAGHYHLALYHVAGNDVPGATGDLRLYAATSNAGPYGADLCILGNDVADSGVYTLTGTECIKQESVDGNGTTSGTYTREADTVTVTGSNAQAGGTVISRWVLDPS